MPRVLSFVREVVLLAAPLQMTVDEVIARGIWIC
jgi:hypothetical protein